MHFSLGLPDGSELVSTFGEEPLCFTLGDGTLAEGLELALYGLRPGAEQTLRIDGDLIYGPRDPANVHRVPLAQFPPGISPAPGLVVAFAGADGTTLPGTLLEIAGDTVQVDFNHPLCGGEVVFRVHILSVTAPPAGAE